MCCVWCRVCVVYVFFMVCVRCVGVCVVYGVCVAYGVCVFRVCGLCGVCVVYGVCDV